MDDEPRYKLTQQGFEHVWSWMRLTSQMCEMEHESDCNDMTHQVAFMLAMILPTPEKAKEAGIFDD